MRAKPIMDYYFYPQQHYLQCCLCFSWTFVSSLRFLFYNCYSFHGIECPNARLSHFVVWFLIWSFLIVITDEGWSPETGWLRFYLYDNTHSQGFEPSWEPVVCIIA